MPRPAKQTRERRKRPSDYHHGDLRAALIAAAAQVVARDGVTGLTLRKLATSLNVSPPAVHYHFANKTALIAAAVAWAFEELDAVLAAAEVACRSPEDVLEQVAAAYVSFAVERPGAFRLTFGSHVADLSLADYDEVSTPGRRAKQRMRRAVAGAFGGEIEHPRSEARFTILWGQLVGIASLVAEREVAGGVDVEQAAALARQAVRSHLVGLPATG